MTNNDDETQPTDIDFAAWRAAEAEREGKAAEAEREAAKWRDAGDLVPSPPEVDPARVLMFEALHAMIGLSMMRGTRAAHMAREVATRALFALGTPEDPSKTAVVERMYRAIQGATTRGDRQAVYDIAALVEVAWTWRVANKEWSDRAPVDLRAKIASLRPDRVEKLTETDLAAWLDARVTRQIETSGVVARILVAMRWFKLSGQERKDGVDLLVKVTKLVDQALRAAKVRAGEHVPKTKRSTPKKRTKRRESKA